MSVRQELIIKLRHLRIHRYVLNFNPDNTLSSSGFEIFALILKVG
jgi:hypothetical protein